LYVAACQARVGSNRDKQDNVILCYNEDVRLDRMIKPPTPIRDVHQIMAADDVLYVVSSYDDQIACYDIERDDWILWQPFMPYAGAGLNVHHINSIFITADEINPIRFHRTHGRAVVACKASAGSWARQKITRSSRPFSDCSVLELDVHCKYVSAVWLRGFGMLHDLRSIDLPDTTSHNGQVFALKPSSLDQRFLKHTFSRSAGRLKVTR